MKRIFIIIMLIAPMAVMAQKFGHFDMESILLSLPEVTKINDEIGVLSKNCENELQTMQNELQLKVDEYLKKRENMSAAEQEETEQLLQAMNQRIQDKVVQDEQYIKKTYEEKMAVVVDKIKLAAQNVGKAGHYTNIFEKNTTFYAGNDSKDVTAEIKAELKKLK
jgi:outer membrane protein